MIVSMLTFPRASGWGITHIISIYGQLQNHGLTEYMYIARSGSQSTLTGDPQQTDAEDTDALQLMQMTVPQFSVLTLDTSLPLLKVCELDSKCYMYIHHL